MAKAVPPIYRRYVSRPDEPTLGLLPGTWYEADMVAALGAFEIVIRQMGYPSEDEAAVNAARDVFARTGKKTLSPQAASLPA